MISPDELHAIKAAWPLEELARRYGLQKLRRQGREWVALSPFQAERTPSFTIVPDKGFYHDFASGFHGDQISLVIAMEGLHGKSAFVEACRLLKEWAGLGDLPDAAKERLAERYRRTRGENDRLAEAKAERQMQTAESLWAQATPIAGTQAAAYLEARGIRPDLLGGWPHALRYLPDLGYYHPDKDGAPMLIGAFPAMVAAIVSYDRPGGRLLGLHRTYLEPGEPRKLRRPESPGKMLPAKKVLGRHQTALIPFGPPGLEMGFGEGIETCLSALCLLAATGRPAIPIWCAVSLGNLVGPGLPQRRPKPHPDREGAKLPSPDPDLAGAAMVVPPVCRRATLLKDNDPKDPASFELLLARGLRRQELQGRRAFIASPPEGMDWNDYWLSLLPTSGTA